MTRKLRLGALKLHEKMTKRKILTRLNELNQTQWLSREELNEIQRTKLKNLVDYAYNNVPYYRRTFDQIGLHPKDLIKDPLCFSKIPILNKAILRENLPDFITTDLQHRKELNQLFTSGSTGTPLVFYQDSRFRDYVTADIQRHMGWAGWKIGDLQAIIWGSKQTNSIKKKTRTKLIDLVWNRIKLNAFQMSNEEMLLFAKKIIKKNPRILFGYGTCIDQFARFVKDGLNEKITFDGIFSTAEVLTPSSRLLIEDVFHCKVHDRYGTLELGGIACECNSHNGLHVSVENNYVEILENGVPVAPNILGEIIVTNLNNFGMPFIRYSIGDFGSWKEDENCPCGRKSIMLESVMGRLTEMFYTENGRLVRAAFSGGFDCFSHVSIKQFQIIQRKIDLIVVRLVPNEEIPKSILEKITRTIHITFGESITIEYEFMQNIPSLPSGKHQYAVTELTKSDFQFEQGIRKK